jgi:hypothetical protein
VGTGGAAAARRIPCATGERPGWRSWICGVEGKICRTSRWMPSWRLREVVGLALEEAIIGRLSVRFCWDEVAGGGRAVSPLHLLP